VESRKYPKLHELGSDSLYYTQDEIRDLIAYTPEIAASAWCRNSICLVTAPRGSSAIPELASGKGPYGIERRWGIFDPAMDPTNEKVYKFLDDLIARWPSFFPDHYFPSHIGGDEVNAKSGMPIRRFKAFRSP